MIASPVYVEEINAIGNIIVYIHHNQRAAVFIRLCINIRACIKQPYAPRIVKVMRNCGLALCHLLGFIDNNRVVRERCANPLEAVRLNTGGSGISEIRRHIKPECGNVEIQRIGMTVEIGCSEIHCKIAVRVFLR